ncbi:sensor histidine kinase [uncultured Cytophaga sp.]|uniref:sensor histidine kinase n=1 Tax=uncultured Cytophaga sp. TaxID=160238 RepID=UPI00260F39AE|nr:sensor histidine kinase [uncultured Cytophaga sp.]
MRIRTLLLYFIFSSVVIHGYSNPIVLTDTTERFDWDKGYCNIYINSLQSKSFSQIKELSNEGKFKPTKTDAPRLQSFNKEMWARVDVEYTGKKPKEFLIELYDFHIDLYDLYVLVGDSVCLHTVGGDSFPFDHRKIKHKNYLHEIRFQPNTAYTIFVRIQSKQSVSVFGSIRTYADVVYYSDKEYMLLSIFYGFLLLMSLYCIIISVVTLQKTYLYFAVNILSVALYSLSNDGLGYQYIWYDHVVLNEFVQSFSIALFSVTSLLYAASFLKLPFFSKNYCRTVWILLTLRIALYVFGFIFYGPLLYMYQIDILILIFIFFIAVYSFSKNYLPARFFIIAYTLLFVGFTIHILMVLGYINNTLFAVYALNFGTIFQLFIFSFALADQVRIVISENRVSQFKLISQLKENDLLKDKLTKELEDKVRERTKELEFKNQQLDAFVYKASHDIKGPLKSIIGLARLGILDIDDLEAREYFHHIEKSSTRLDTLVADLLQVSKINNNVIQQTQIDFQEIIEEVQFSLNNIVDFETFKIEINVTQDRDFYSDRNMVYSIFQNLIENAFTYRDREKGNSFIKIRIEIDKQKTVFEFVDNGIGINKDLKDKVFDMFYRASDISGGSGLGLYLVKMAVNKIGGRINVESKMKKGTTFTIVI